MADIAIAEFIAFLGTVPHGILEAAEGAMERACQLVEHEAKADLGTYQGAMPPFTAWAELADSTKADRVRQGFTENDPGLRSGKMRDSIGHSVEAVALDQVEGIVGSEDDNLVWFELGTATQEARSVLGGALVREEDAVVEILGRAAHWALSGGGPSGLLD